VWIRHLNHLDSLAAHPGGAYVLIELVEVIIVLDYVGLCFKNLIHKFLRMVIGVLTLIAHRKRVGAEVDRIKDGLRQSV